MNEINLKEFFGSLKKFIVFYILVLAAALTGTYFYDTEVKTPLYQSTTKVVLVQPENSDNAASTLNGVSASQKLTATYSEIVKSELVLEQAFKELHEDIKVDDFVKNQLKVNTVEETSILSISVKDESAEKSADLANKIAEVFSKEISKIYNLDNIVTYSKAKVPEKPANNTTTRDLIIAGLFAVFGVTAIAFLKFYFDDSVKYSEDIERTLKIPIAGKIVKNETKFVTNGKRRDNNGVTSTVSGEQGNAKVSPELVVEKRPKAIISENIKSLRTNLQFSAVDNELKTILVTSTNASEGKSFVAANLAVSFAQADKRVLIVDCDLRKGRLHKLFGVSNLAGLSNLLMDEILNSRRYIQQTGVKNLSIITRGSYPPNPSELLASKKNKGLIFRLRNDYDIVIFDGTPVSGLADSVILSTLVDETLIVAKDGATTKSALNDTKESLNKVGANIAGIVFNGIDKKIAKYYSYYGDEK